MVFIAAASNWFSPLGNIASYHVMNHHVEFFGLRVAPVMVSTAVRCCEFAARIVAAAANLLAFLLGSFLFVGTYHTVGAYRFLVDMILQSMIPAIIAHPLCTVVVIETDDICDDAHRATVCTVVVLVVVAGVAVCFGAMISTRTDHVCAWYFLSLRMVTTCPS